LRSVTHEASIRSFWIGFTPDKETDVDNFSAGSYPPDPV